jgi:hypothetical protein
MTNDYKYPSGYELREVFSSVLDRPFINEFAQTRGIFLTNAKSEELAAELSNLFYEEDDLEGLRNEAFQKDDNATLSSFIVTSSYEDFDLKVIYDNIVQSAVFDSNLILTALRKPDKDDDVYVGEIEYNKSKVGRIQFLQNEQANFGFAIEKIKSGIWKVEVDCSRSSDLTHVRKLFEEYIREDDAVFETIDYKSLTKDQNISFFDQLGRKALSEDWQLQTVSHVFIKHESSIQKTMLDERDKEGEEKEIEEQEKLFDISQAILTGKNLRNNEFVEDFVKKGYRFTAMTYQFHQKDTPNIIHITADFKGRNRQFEVSIDYVGEWVGYEGIEPTEVPITREHKAMRSVVWGNAKMIFDSFKQRK